MIAVAIFLVAHLALLIGLTTPEKFVFDEVHYVPAARQMLAPAVSQSMLNPMHPPLAKELIALSIAAFGDSALGWRYPATLFGALAIVAIYLCGLALFAAQGPAIAAALIAACNQMLYVQARVAMLDILHSASACSRLPPSCMAFERIVPMHYSRLPAACSAVRPPANGAACFRSESASSSSR